MQTELLSADQEKSLFFRARSSHLAARRTRMGQRLLELVKALLENRQFRNQIKTDAPKALKQFGFYQKSLPHCLDAPSKVNVFLAERDLFANCEIASPDFAPIDIRLVYHGARDLAVHFGSAEQLSQYAAWAESRSLVTLLTPCGRSADRVSSGGAIGYRGLIVAANERQAELAWLAYLCEWHQVLASMLAIPACCYEGNARRLWPVSAGNSEESAFPSFPPSGSFPWYCNVFGQYFGHPLLCHIPCRFDCRASAATALWYLNQLRIYEPEYAAALPSHLASVVMQSGNNISVIPGVAVASGQADGHMIDYDPDQILSTMPDSAFPKLARTSSRILWNSDEVKVGQTSVVGCKIWNFTDRADARPQRSLTLVAKASKNRWREQDRILPRME